MVQYSWTFTPLTTFLAYTHASPSRRPKMGLPMAVVSPVTRRTLNAALSHSHCADRRTFISGLFKKLTSSGSDKEQFKQQQPLGRRPRKLLLEQDNLFHVLADSPIPDMRKRAERVKRLAPCPVNLRNGKRVLVNFDCPECGWPTHYSEKEWREDTEKAKYFSRLREANEDEHDLRSGREMVEFKLPGPQGYEEAINFSSWDVYFYTRGFPSIETERSRRHVSKLLTFPSTIAGVLHENSPYTTRNRRMTREGTRSFLALRQLLHPQLGARQSLDSIRIFVVGARAESTLPTSVWDQLRFLFPGVHFHLYLIGPEVVLPNWNPLPLAPPNLKKTSADTKVSASDTPEPGSTTALGKSPNRSYKARSSEYGPNAPSKTFVISEALTTTYIRCNYEEVHHQLEPFDPYTDVFFAFSPGFGFPSQKAYDRPKGEEDDVVVVDKKTATGNAEPQQVQGYDRIAADIERIGEMGEKKGGNDNAGDAATADGPPGTSYSTLPTLPPLLQSQVEWAQALTQMLSTKVPIIITGFSPADVKRDVEAFETVEGIKGEFEWLITPGENTFGSLSWVIADFDPRVAVKANWGIWAVRGKRYDLAGPGAFVNLNPFSDEGLERSEREGV